MFSLKKIALALLFLIIGTYNLQAKPLKIVSITADFASIAKSVGGKHVHVVHLINGSLNMHDITPKPSMLINVRSADMIIRIGMKQDTWIDSLIDVSGNANLFKGKPGYIDASEAIEALEVPSGNVDGSMGDIHIYGNPHYWLNPYNGILIAKKLADALKNLDPDNNLFYDENYRTFEKKMHQKINDWKKAMTPLKGTACITYHKTWAYFFDTFDLKPVGQLEPLPGIPPSAKHIAKLKRTFPNYKKRLILTASYYPKKPGMMFAKSTQSTFYHLPTNVGSKQIKSYEGLFDYLVKQLSPQKN